MYKISSKRGFDSNSKQKYFSRICISRIFSDEREKEKAKDRKKNPPKPGLRGGIKKLYELGFPEDQLIKRIQKEYGLNNYEDVDIIKTILYEEIEEIKAKKARGIEYER